MPSWRTLVGTSETLTAADLDAVGGQVTAVIESVGGAKFEEEAKADSGEGEDVTVNKVDRKALIAFKGKRLKFAANTINCSLIEAMWGEDYSGWPGHHLTIMSDKVEVAGRFKGDPCIRVKGSPELTGPQKVTIKLPRRRPIERTIVPTGKTPSEQSGGDPGRDTYEGY